MTFPNKHAIRKTLHHLLLPLVPVIKYSLSLNPAFFIIAENVVSLLFSSGGLSATFSALTIPGLLAGVYGESRNANGACIPPVPLDGMGARVGVGCISLGYRLELA